MPWAQTATRRLLTAEAISATSVSYVNFKVTFHSPFRGTTNEALNVFLHIYFYSIKHAECFRAIQAVAGNCGGFLLEQRCFPSSFMHIAADRYLLGVAQKSAILSFARRLINVAVITLAVILASGAVFSVRALLNLSE